MQHSRNWKQLQCVPLSPLLIQETYGQDPDLRKAGVCVAGVCIGGLGERCPDLGFCNGESIIELSCLLFLKQHDVGVIRCGDDGICGGENAQVSSATEDVRKFCVSGMSRKAARSSRQLKSYR